MGSFLNQFKKIAGVIAVGVILTCRGEAQGNIERLTLDIIEYEAFIQDSPEALKLLNKALHGKGIVGIKGVPGYKEKVFKFIEKARAFSELPEKIKEVYAPSSDEMFLGYEKGKEKFKDDSGKWIVDDLKNSYYAYVPDSALNKWPSEVDLKIPFQELGILMSEVAEGVMRKMGLIGSATGISLDGVPRVGRMLYYANSLYASSDNPLWCGSHFDHSLFTALIPAFYFVDGKRVSEPLEAGLFIKTTSEGIFKKVIIDDPDVLLFQVGEFGQLVTDDAIRATEHRVGKALRKGIERYTMALFFNPPMETVIRSFSVLTEDTRYGGEAGDLCSYRHWHDASFDRYIVR